MLSRLSVVQYNMALLLQYMENGRVDYKSDSFWYLPDDRNCFCCADESAEDGDHLRPMYETKEILQRKCSQGVDYVTIL